ncbi:hypothetical protein [Phenylobacterium sp.]|uniref:hypothetical protein n=1 Tax=Phenylobacterium sp. TaxID=1871053 RepID=UPI0011FE332D|nr:hypothetical protein [Phenylobacterium sp.]THD64100.1 MAG: hypothetical protein E8A49_03655 [Phenylobacterium sp.]
MRRFLPAAACAAALLGAAALPSAASADIHWTVSGTFDDTGTLSGWFNINQYGYLDGYDLTTTAGAAEAGFNYTPADSYFANGDFYVDAQPGYQADLHLTFADTLTTPVANNPIEGGEGGPSYECTGSYSCYIPEGGTTRYLASGEASAAGAAPEPAIWMTMVLGFGLLGGALRAARRQGGAVPSAA